MRQLVSALLLACTGVLFVHWCLDVAEARGWCLIPGLRAQGQAIDRRREERNRFADQLQTVLENLAEGRLLLAEASSQVQAAASALNPTYLLYVDCAEAHGNLQVKVAHRLLEQLDPKDRAVSPSISPSLHRALRAQYERLAALGKHGS